jgi:transketolase
MHTIKPIDVDAIVRAAQETGGIATIEEHQLLGGLGSSVADVLQDAEINIDRFWRFGITDTIARNVGSQDYLRQQFGLTAQDIVKRLVAVRSQSASHESRTIRKRLTI